VVAPRLENQPNTNRSIPVEYDPTNVDVDDVLDVLDVAFHTMDRGVKEFFSDIVVPTKDGMKPLTVRVAGGDKTILFWKQALSTGRVEVPIMSVNLTGWNYDPNRATPAVAGPAYKRFADQDGTRAIRTPREIPYLLDYTLSIWTFRKKEMGYILHQIQSRFDPMAEWVVEDEFMCGHVLATFEGGTNNNDIDVGAEEWAKVRTDLSIKVEGWLPRSGTIVPTILGQVTSLEELDTREFFGAIKSNPRGF
jgi:hypothetical protein